MIKIIVDSILNLEGDLIVEAKLPYSILPSSKYRYDLKRRLIAINIIKEFLKKSKDAIDIIKKTAEEDYKEKYGKKIKIVKLNLKDIQFKSDYIYAIFNAVYQELKNKRKKKDIVI